MQPPVEVLNPWDMRVLCEPNFYDSEEIKEYVSMVFQAVKQDEFSFIRNLITPLMYDPL